MTSPSVDVSHLDCTGAIHRLDRELARIVRERDEAYTAIAELLRAAPHLVETEVGHEARRVIGEMGR